MHRPRVLTIPGTTRDAHQPKNKADQKNQNTYN